VIRDWWHREMDARRAFSVLLYAVALALSVLAFAAMFSFLPRGDNDVGLLWYAPGLGGAFGIATRAYLLHRGPGRRHGLVWATIQGGSMALLLLGMFAVARAVSPVIGGNSAFGGDTWLGLAALAVVIGLIGAFLWERNPTRRRASGIFLLAAALIIGGLLGVRAGGWWTLPGAGLLGVGVIAAIAATTQGFVELKREMAESGPGTSAV